MKANALFALGVLVVLAAGACGQKESDDGADGGSAGSAGVGAGTGGSPAAGRGGASGAGAAQAGAAAGPAISSAPPAWVRPAECGGIGNRCPNLSGCGPLSVCQLEGNVCIPTYPADAGALPSRSAEHPYCAAYTCMSFDEASCFCTGEAAAVTPNCSSPGALSGLCRGQDGSCAITACCDGLSCIDSGNGKVCKQACTSSTECSTGCCTDLYDTGATICAPADACTDPCKKRGEACTQGSSTTPNDCCRGSCLDSDNPDYAGCRPNCTTNEQCTETGCCVLFADSTDGFCASALYCSCNELGGACGPGNPACCEGTTCAGTQAGGFTCRRSCVVDADCPSGNCQPLSDNSASICAETPSACSPVGSACGSGTSCCTGLTCAGFTEDDFECFTTCVDDSDCGTGFCLPVQGGGGICQDDESAE